MTVPAPSDSTPGGAGTTTVVRQADVGWSPDAVAGVKACRDHLHSRWDAKILAHPTHPDAERWDRIASRLYEREHPTS